MCVGLSVCAFMCACVLAVIVAERDATGMVTKVQGSFQHTDLRVNVAGTKRKRELVSLD